MGMQLERYSRLQNLRCEPAAASARRRSAELHSISISRNRCISRRFILERKMAAWIVTWKRWRLAGVFPEIDPKHAGETPALPGPNPALVAAWPGCAVSQISNLLNGRESQCGKSLLGVGQTRSALEKDLGSPASAVEPMRPNLLAALQNAILRYSRLQICVTDKGTSHHIS